LLLFRLLNNIAIEQKWAKMKYAFRISFIAVILAGVVSCDNDNNDPVDVTAPAIELEEPVVEEFFHTGDYIHFKATFTDDIELGSYSIDIHDNIDGHSHGRIFKTYEDPSLLQWNFKENFTFPVGQKVVDIDMDDQIEIPSNAIAGPYHFIIQAIDKAGNATSYQDDSTVEIEIFITNNSMPAVNITNLDDDELEIEQGEKFMVTGDISDPTAGEYAGMHALTVILGKEHEGHDHDHGGRIGEDDHDLIDADYEEEELEQFMADDKIILDNVFEHINFTLSQEQLEELQEEEVDHLVLIIQVRDEQGNMAVSHTEVHVHAD
jgi:hypothetical protein